MSSSSGSDEEWTDTNPWVGESCRETSSQDWRRRDGEDAGDEDGRKTRPRKRIGYTIPTENRGKSPENWRDGMGKSPEDTKPTRVVNNDKYLPSYRENRLLRDPRRPFGEENWRDGMGKPPDDPRKPVGLEENWRDAMGIPPEDIKPTRGINNDKYRLGFRENTPQGKWRVGMGKAPEDSKPTRGVFSDKFPSHRENRPHRLPHVSQEMSQESRFFSTEDVCGRSVKWQELFIREPTSGGRRDVGDQVARFTGRQMSEQFAGDTRVMNRGGPGYRKWDTKGGISDTDKDRESHGDRSFSLGDIEKLRYGSIRDLIRFLESDDGELDSLLEGPALKTRNQRELESILGLISKIIQSDEIAISYTQGLMNKVATALNFFQTVLEIYTLNTLAGISEGLQNVVLILRYLLHSLPSTSHEMVSILLPKIELIVRKRGIAESSCIGVELHKVKVLHEAILERIIAGDSFDDEIIGDSFDEFIDMPIFPTIRDIGPDSKAPDLTENIVRGKYKNGMHYLNAQFRLMREDLIGPLRCCIKELRGYQQRNHKVSKLEDGFCYNEVQFVRVETTQNDFGCRVKFDVTHLSNANWEKRLLYGNLVLLSSDGFDTFFVATVGKRDEKEMAKGEVVLQIEDGSLDFVVGRERMVMIEGSSFLPAYQFVLERLQDLGYHCYYSETIPYQKYLVKCQTDVRPPLYISTNPTFYVGVTCKTQNEPRSLLDLASRRSLTIDVMNKTEWNALSGKGLDASQLDALHKMFTNEVCVIQGPPGTGKTFIGLAFLEILLANRHLGYDRDKILVMCLTNHALDQFLEGVVNIMSINERDDSIIRIGGNSQNEKLKEHTLINASKRFRLKYEGKQLWEISEEMEISKAELFFGTGGARPSHLSINEVLHSAHTNQLHSLRQAGMDTVSAVLIWLQGTSLDEARHHQERRANRVDDDAAEAHGQDGRLETRNDELGNDEEWCEVSRHGRLRTRGQTRLPSETRRHVNLAAPVSSHEADVIEDVWALPLNQRRALYARWALTAFEAGETFLLDSQFYQALCRDRDAIYAGINRRAIDAARIIGVTTTGAAKYFDLIKEVEPTIVIVEEAAEVLESHIVTALTEKCEHLLLIGDHKQLRPNPTMYRLARDYNLDISLFERMVRNELPVSTLEIQHRMRPEVSQFLVPHIYRDLSDHDSVTSFPHMDGIQGDVVFVNHQEPEKGDGDKRSKSNTHEAGMVAGLCKYLLQQGYRSDQVTILTMYTGQVYQINGRLKELNITDVRVVPVDNFQGEENDIIIMSYVRSNGRRKIGFLKASNRICVSLSRAKQGLYCFGNFTMYADVHDLWRRLVQDFDRKGVLKDHLSLKCSNHSTLTHVSKPGEFQQVRDGGCSALCGFQLECGHVCPLSCHPLDPEHREFKCKKPCERKCTRGHSVCKRDCNEKCEPCSANVLVEKEECGHRYNTECSKADDACSVPCERLIPCGHVCQNLCGDACTLEWACKIRVTVDKSCGHSYQTDCCKSKMTCQMPCEKELVCGHSCKMECGRRCTSICIEPCQKIKACGHQCHLRCYQECTVKPCKVMVDQILPCGHPVEVVCSKRDEFIRCDEMITVRLDCGHNIEACCCEAEDARARPCTADVLVDLDCGHRRKFSCHVASSGTCVCDEVVEKVLPCGHITGIGCSVDPATEICLRLCLAKLDCGHICRGTCSSCRVVHRRCKDPCQRYLWCSHPCQGTCGELCPPCSQQVEYECSHGTQGFQKCGMWNESCRLPCASKCLHHRCTKPCNEKCNRPPCNEPCQKKLHCGHECMGFCGEPCPRVCSTCNPNVGFREGEEVRFVVVYPCCHDIPVNEMDKLMKRPGGEIQEIEIKCPRARCRRPILYCPHYDDIIKENLYVMFKEHELSKMRYRDEPDKLGCIHFSEQMSQYQRELESAILSTKSHLNLVEFSDILQALSCRVTQRGDADCGFAYAEMEAIRFIAECSLIHLEHMKLTGCCGICRQPISKKCDCLTPSKKFKALAGDVHHRLVELRKQYQGMLTDSTMPLGKSFMRDHKWYKCHKGHYFYSTEASNDSVVCEDCSSSHPGDELSRMIRKTWGDEPVVPEPERREKFGRQSKRRRPRRQQRRGGFRRN